MNSGKIARSTVRETANIRQNIDARVVCETLTLFVKHLPSSVIIILYQQLKFNYQILNSIWNAIVWLIC